MQGKERRKHSNVSMHLNFSLIKVAQYSCVTTNLCEDLPICCSMKVLSVRGTLFFPTLVCPLFRISSRTDFKLGNLLGSWVVIMCKKKTYWIYSSTSVSSDSPPGHVGLHDLHHGHRGLVDFDKGPAEDLPQSQHLDHLHHFGTDTLYPIRTCSFTLIFIYE